jgi:hypothetical protein
MVNKPPIIRLVADKACELYYAAALRGADLPQPRVLSDEIGVVFGGDLFIPYADLGYNDELGFFQLSASPEIDNQAAPYAAGGTLISPGKITVTPGVALRLSAEEIRTLLDRHVSGDFGEFGRFYEIDITDEMLREGVSVVGGMSKVNALTGLDCVISEYVVRDGRIWVITEPGPQRSTIFVLAGVERHSSHRNGNGNGHH